MKIHARDIRLYNNAGISVPVCVADSIPNKRYRLATHVLEINCAKCLAIYPRRYPWAVHRGGA